MSDFTPADLPRVAERIPYLYLEQCVIKRMNNALVAADENGETQLPIATIAVLMLGPGTTITHDAVVLASDTGAIIVWAGEQGVRHYCSGSALTGSTRLLEQQARLVSNERSRLMVARRMYAMRFPGEDLSHTTMRQLLGMEGTRVAALYTAEARRNGIQWHGRKWDARGGAVNRTSRYPRPIAACMVSSMRRSPHWDAVRHSVSFTATIVARSSSTSRICTRRSIRSRWLSDCTPALPAWLAESHDDACVT